ncbi:MAG: ribonuclease H [Bacteroides sp.]|nr:ribonuclease H [Bacteroides sp.]
MAKNTKYYVVWNGRNTGVYDNWDDCLEQVKNYPNPLYKAFPSPEAAARAYREGFAKEDRNDLSGLLNGVANHREATHGVRDYFDNPEVDLKAWAVDAACSGNPGPVEYRGVELMTGKELFRIGPLEDGTNNLGEFLAIVHALALMDKMGETHPIYSDSVSGMAWVRNRCIKTTLQRTPRNEKLFNMLERAMNWLNTHSYSARIMKWDTPRWGEIPADFGRKGGGKGI